MCRSHDGADAGFAFGDRRERDAGAEHTFFEEFAGEVHGEFAIAGEAGSDGSVTVRSSSAPDVEAEQAQFFFPEARILPELFHALRLILQNVERRNASCRHRRWMRCGKQKRARPVIKKINQIARAADVSAERADG